MKSFLNTILLIIFLVPGLSGQSQVIHLTNPSFEGLPAAGNNYFFLQGWGDCAPYYFQGETPPDIHQFGYKIFDVNVVAQEGNSFVGMVTRENRETWEMISQKLESMMLADKCYEFSIHLAKADLYLSGIDPSDKINLVKKNFNKAVKLRIWGSSSPCKKTQLLAESELVNHSDWKEYTFKFKPKRNYTYILFEVFYKTPVLVPYNGNLLLDNAGDIIEIPCPDDNLLAQVEINKPKPTIITPSSNITKPKKVSRQKDNSNGAAVASNEKDQGKKQDSSLASRSKRKEKILKKLNKKTIAPGQTIKIEKLFFEADSSRINDNSHEVLDEIFTFLNDNPNVIIEIGGHTNGVPGVEYCKHLSTERAKNVAEYLYIKGIPEYRIKFKGYGKSKPLDSDRTLIGRKKNQRVEIKILRAR